MTGTMSQLEDASPFDEGENAKDPVLPSAKRNSCGDEVIGESEWVIEQVEEKAHETLDVFHNKTRV